MIASASALVDAPGVLRRVSSQPPLTIRQVFSERPGECALCLVGSAAGPLPGDELGLRIDVAAGARASLVASGATIAQGRGGAAATITMQVTVGDGATLDADPGTLIVCAGARVDLHLCIELAATATLRWRELLVLGRTGEPAGAAVLHWDVTRAGRPLLRQALDLSDPAAHGWPGLLAGQRELTSELTVGPDLHAVTTVHTPTHVTQRMAEHATLTTRLGR